MSQDYLQVEQRERNEANLLLNDNHRNQTLHYLQQKFGCLGKSLQDFGLPSPPNEANEHIPNNTHIMIERNYHELEQLESAIQREDMLNEDQRNVYNFVCRCVDSNTSEMIFIDAPGGTGKTFLINTILSKVRGTGHIALAVASSGIAATLMPGGRTAHSRFKLPLTVKENDLCNFDKKFIYRRFDEKYKNNCLG